MAEAAEARRIFVNAVDDPANASAFLSGVVRRDGVTLAISTSGAAPALTALLREGARRAAAARSGGVDVAGARGSASPGGATACRWTARKPLLLQALNALYRNEEPPSDAEHRGEQPISATLRDRRLRLRHAVPWLNAPEDSWL